MVFEVGDAVVHPIRGAGVVADIEELQRRGDSKEHYRIQLLSQPRTSLLIPVEGIKERGLRHAVQQSKLGRVWRVLLAHPKQLPADYEARYELLDEKLQSGNLLQIAEAVRDLAWRLKKRDNLTIGDRQKYQKGMRLVSGEIAAARGDDLVDVEAQVKARLWGCGDTQAGHPWQRKRVAQYPH